MFLRIVLFLLGLLAASTVYHQIRKRIEIKKNPAPGEMITVGDSRMHIYGEGEGSPAILFTCGNGMGFTLGNYYPIFSELAKKTRVIVYDRFGYGWSDSTLRPRTIKQINEDLYELLDKSRETGPFILVGHSLGATEVVQFAQRYPELVSGIITLDGTSPAFYKDRKNILFQNTVTSIVARFLSVTGLLRVLINLNLLSTAGMSSPDEIVKITNMMTYNRVYSNEAVAEVKELINNNEEQNSLGDIPLLVMTADNQKMKKKQPETYNYFADSQKELLTLSIRSRQIIIKDADHFFPIKMPDIIIEELQNFFDLLQADSLTGSSSKAERYR